MFKNQYINQFLLLILLTILTFLNCDGRYRKHKINTKKIELSTTYTSPNESIKFIPKHDLNIVTDTIMKNGFQIKINYSTVGSYNILKIKDKTPNRIAKVFYKNFEAKLYVSNKGSKINNSVISKKLFYKFEDSEFWNNAVMQYVWVNHHASTKNELILNTAFNIPNTEIYKDFVLIIDKQGHLKIEQKQLS